MKLMIHFFDYIFLMRPMLLMPVWTFFLVGSYRGILDSGYWKPDTGFAVAFILYTFLMGGVYVLNQIIDIESDRVNKKLYLLPEGYIKVSHAWIEVGVLFALAWILAIPFSKEFKIILLLSMILGILYSIPPFKFKARPILDLLSNSVGYGVLAFSLGWVTEVLFSKLIFLYSLPYFFAVGAVFINTTIPDIEGDKKAGEITTGILLGPQKAYWVATGFILTSFVLSVYLTDWVCAIACIVSAPAFLLTSIKHELKYCLISIRIGILTLAILVGIKFIWFIPWLAILFCGMRIYYKHRFNIVYPRLGEQGSASN